MYQSSNLIFYADSETTLQKPIQSLIINHNLPFKEIRHLGVVFSVLKNPSTFTILLIKNSSTLKKFQQISKICHNSQSRIFAIYETKDLNDHFFENFCVYADIDKINNFLIEVSRAKQTPPQHQPSKLLSLLVKSELENLNISSKYTGFKYLIDLITNSLRHNFCSNNYIELFEYVACMNFANIDSIERDVRYILLTSWKNNLRFKSLIQNLLPSIECPNSKHLLKAIINYVKIAI